MRIFRGAPARQPWWMPLPQLEKGYGQDKGPFAPRPRAATWKRKTRRFHHHAGGKR